MERTLVLVKPDAVARQLTGEILARYEAKGLRLVAMDLRLADAATVRAHYAEHEGKPFFDGLVEFLTSGPLVAAVLEGESAIACARALNGATNPVEAAPGTIRGDFCTVMRHNAVHASDSLASAAREIDVWFPGLA